MQVKSLVAAVGLGAAAGLALSLAMPELMQDARRAMGRALHKAECVCQNGMSAMH